MITKLFKKYNTIGIVGNTNSGKTQLALTELLNLKEKYEIDVYVYGIDSSLHKILQKNKIKIIRNKEDILDLKIKNSVIYIDEFADIFDVTPRSKQGERIKRFFNRVFHLNDYILISTASQNFWNKFICGLIKSFIIKSIDFDSLVNGTTLKRKVMGLENTSDYRLDIPQNRYYALSNELTEKGSFKYNPSLDSKKDLKNPFAEKKVEKKGEKKLKKKEKK
jgi:Ni2+-binding GTPase involved in maturation of urease and hydrogenase